MKHLTKQPYHIHATRYSYVSSEILSCDVISLWDAMLAEPSTFIDPFFTFLDAAPPLNSLQASHWAKVMSSMLMKKTTEMLKHMKSHEKIVEKLLSHMDSSVMADLLMRLISLDDLPEGAGTVQWLQDAHLVEKLVDRLDPNLDTDIHTTATSTLLELIALTYGPPLVEPPTLAYNSETLQTAQQRQSQTRGLALIDELKSDIIVKKLIGFMLTHDAPSVSSTLTNSINIIIEIIRRYCAYVSLLMLPIPKVTNVNDTVCTHQTTNSEIEQAEYQHQQSLLPPNQPGVEPPVAPERLLRLAVDLTDLMASLRTCLPEFVRLLRVSRNMPELIDTTIGKMPPLGSERLKICELFAEILHLKYLVTSSPLFEGLVADPNALDDDTETDDSDVDRANEQPRAPSKRPPKQTFNELVANITKGKRLLIDELIDITDGFVSQNVLPLCLDHFFNFKWNNFLHSVVYDMIAKVFNTYTFCSSSPILATRGSQTLAVFSDETNDNNVGTANGPTNDNAESEKTGLDNIESEAVELDVSLATQPKSESTGTDQNHMQDSIQLQSSQIQPGLDISFEGPSVAEKVMLKIQAASRRLVLNILVDGKLTLRIVEAQRLSNYEESQPRGVRLGYMGHLTYISDEVVKLVDKCGQDDLLEHPDIKRYTNSETWVDYVTNTLRETKERDRKALGGTRPHMTDVLPHGAGDEFSDEADMGYTGPILNKPFLGATGSFGATMGLTNMLSSSNGHASDDEDEYDGDALMEMDTESDQLARYLCQQIVTDLPSRRLGGEDSSDEEDEDEDKEWLNAFGPVGLQYTQKQEPKQIVLDDEKSAKEEPSASPDSSVGLASAPVSAASGPPPGLSFPTTTSASQPLTVADWAAEFHKAFPANEEIPETTSSNDSPLPNSAGSPSLLPNSAGTPSPLPHSNEFPSPLELPDMKPQENGTKDIFAMEELKEVVESIEVGLSGQQEKTKDSIEVGLSGKEEMTKDGVSVEVGEKKEVGDKDGSDNDSEVKTVQVTQD